MHHDTGIPTADFGVPSPRAPLVCAAEDLNTQLQCSDADFVAAMQKEFNLSRVSCICHALDALVAVMDALCAKAVLVH